MNLIDVSRKLQSEDQCLDFIEKVRWPDGVVRCPTCGSDKISRITRNVDETKTRRQKKQNKRTRLYACLESTCKYRFTPTVGTLFHDSHLPLSKWFAAVALIVHAKKGMSAKQVQRHLGVNYRTAWYMGHRIRKAMSEGSGIMAVEMELTPARPKLSGTVEMDETYIGGKKHGACVRGRGAEKEIVVGIRQRQGDLRFFHAADAKSGTLAEYIREHVSEDVDRIVTDEWSAYPDAMRRTGMEEKHRTIRHKGGVYAVGDIHTNTVESAFSLLKRGIIGSFHKLSAKHMHRYLSEFEYRFNGREMPDLFGTTVANMVNTGAMKYTELIAN